MQSRRLVRRIATIQLDKAYDQVRIRSKQPNFHARLYSTRDLTCEVSYYVDETPAICACELCNYEATFSENGSIAPNIAFTVKCSVASSTRLRRRSDLIPSVRIIRLDLRPSETFFAGIQTGSGQLGKGSLDRLFKYRFHVLDPMLREMQVVECGHVTLV